MGGKKRRHVEMVKTSEIEKKVNKEEVKEEVNKEEVREGRANSNSLETLRKKGREWRWRDPQLFYLHSLLKQRLHYRYTSRRCKNPLLVHLQPCQEMLFQVSRSRRCKKHGSWLVCSAKPI